MSPLLCASASYPLVRVYTQKLQGERWLERHQGQLPVFACVLGFTETGLLPGISAAGATPADRQYTAIADAEFLYHGPQTHPAYPLPPLIVGASPALISRAILAGQQIPLYLFNAGLPSPPAVPAIDLHGVPASCVSQGKAMALPIVERLLQQGLLWGEKLAATEPGYLILGECVVGGTTTALAVLAGLGIAAAGKVNSSHPDCNHDQKWSLVQAGLQRSGLWTLSLEEEKTDPTPHTPHPTPLQIVAAVGDPMQIVVAGMAIAASRTCGVLLAGGTQMLAVYALLRAIADSHYLAWQPDQIVVGTTRWVADDRTGDTVGLAKLVGDVPLLATQLSFASSRYEQLRAYEQGFVKEGVGAGGCAIAACLYKHWSQAELLEAIETLAEQHQQLSRRRLKHHN
ncbi:nicotinate mononucleotide-dependent phosphoribosyltransferase CobT [Stenomitos frigidus]|uniref:nicotinate mononucleotide-dependent phosphoribosyltransferase CobT n=1 Tax=Stenomitos frigidus TaxID=1886765 RepID=UPI001FEB39DE|nr:TIGR00303 family protein [Stenomitos frigidus]